MRTSCVSWPEKERILILRESAIALCDGDHCAAALLTFFEHGHNYKLAHQAQATHANEVAALHGDPGVQETSLLQYHTEDDLEAGLLHHYGRSMIRRALTALTIKGFISIHKNPVKRYYFDKTHYFLFHPDVVMAELRVVVHDVKITDRDVTSNAHEALKITDEGVKNNATITKLTPELTTEITKHPPLVPLPGEHALEIKIPPATKRPRKTPMPTDLTAQETLQRVIVDDALLAWIQHKRLACDVEEQWEAFVNKAIANGYQYADWRHAFMNWLTSPYQQHAAGRVCTPENGAAAIAWLKGTQ